MVLNAYYQLNWTFSRGNSAWSFVRAWGMPKMGLKLQCADSRRRVVFAFGLVGFAGQTSEGELDFRIIAAEEKEVALATFEKLVASGNPQAAAYGLFGIRRLRPSRFQERLPDFESRAK